MGMRYILLAIFAALVVTANWVTNEYGMFHGLFAAGTFAAGMTFLVRDWLQEAGGRWFVLAAILLGAGLSAWWSTPTLALASGVAFLVSETSDFLVYTPLRRRTRVGAMLASNTVGAIVDSLLFLTLAGFPIASWGVQAVVKVAVTIPFVLVPLLVRRARTA
jgi:queuosine precursor transporter